MSTCNSLPIWERFFNRHPPLPPSPLRTRLVYPLSTYFPNTVSAYYCLQRLIISIVFCCANKGHPAVQGYFLESELMDHVHLYMCTSSHNKKQGGSCLLASMLALAMSLLTKVNIFAIYLLSCQHSRKSYRINCCLALRIVGMLFPSISTISSICMKPF